MQNRNAEKSHLFLIEFLIVLIFFFIISTVCLRVFVLAYRTTKDAEALSHAQTLASSVLEICKTGEDLSSYFPEGVWAEGGSSEESSVFSLTCEKDFSFCASSSAEAAYVLTAHITRTGHDASITVSVTQTDGTDVFDLSAGFHTPYVKEEIAS